MVNCLYKRLLVVVFTLLLLPSCALQIISPYDQQTLAQMTLIAKKVDRHFLALHYLTVDERDFSYFKNSYLDIAVELQALNNRQQIRSINELTSRQVDIAMTLWQQHTEQHQKANSLSNFLTNRYRKQYNRLFLAMIKGEAVKNN